MSTPISAIAISHPATNETARRRPFDMLSKMITVTTDTGLVKAIARPSAATSAISVPTHLTIATVDLSLRRGRNLTHLCHSGRKPPAYLGRAGTVARGNPQPQARWLSCRRFTYSRVRCNNRTAVAKIGVLVAVIGIAFALPARAHAVDHLVLDISPTRMAAAASVKTSKQERARLRQLARWRLDARIVGRDFYRSGDAEIFGVSLTRSFSNGHELHAFRAAPRQTVTFDGERGRLKARFGKTLAIDMEIVATAAPHAVEPALPCRGAFAEVAVRLRGTLVLRTGTRFFRTIHRARLSGVVNFNAGGVVDCTPQASTECGNSSTLSVSHGADAALLMSPDENGWTSLSIADRSAASATGYTWYHVMYALGSNPLSGQLPTIAAHLTGPLPIQGSGTFTAQQTSTDVDGACRSTSTTGTFDGTFRVRFAGWGLRTLRLSSADHATFREQRHG